LNDYFLPLALADRLEIVRFRVFEILDPNRFSDDCTMKAERVKPAFTANRSIASSWLLRAVILIRTVFSATGSTLTRTATAPFMFGSFAKASRSDGPGTIARFLRRYGAVPSAANTRCITSIGSSGHRAASIARSSSSKAATSSGARLAPTPALARIRPRHASCV
jgi:hypothetical protein